MESSACFVLIASGVQFLIIQNVCQTCVFKQKVEAGDGTGNNLVLSTISTWDQGASWNSHPVPRGMGTGAGERSEPCLGIEQTVLAVGANYLQTTTKHETLGLALIAVGVAPLIGSAE